MGKGTDKLYITHSEWSSSDQFSASAGAGVRASSNQHASFKRLPYNYCALSLQPFQTPVCTPGGQIFDHENIIRWLLNHDTNPTNGQPLRQSDLIKLNFAQNEGGGYVDPVTFKEFTDNTHMIAIRHGPSANVFAYDTVERLNFKPKMWNDLVSDEEFTKRDIITLQDPQKLESRDLNKFKYLKEGEDSGVPKEEAEINVSAMGNAAKILKAKEAVAKARAERSAATLQKSGQKNDDTIKTPAQPAKAKKATPYNATKHTTGLAAASFTSTGVTPTTSNALALMSDEEYLLKRGRVKQKGYARMETSLGELTLELYPEYAPKAVWNFVKLAQKGYYDGISFHRNIKNFMVQGGDPTGTGRGGTSVWGKPFQDELQGPMKHDSRGVVSMANKGKDTNSSQFFFTYRKTLHLDGKHTIFGKVVDSDVVLKAMEDAEVGQNDRPVEDIVIEKVSIYIDPFEQFQKERNATETDQRRKEEQQREGTDDDSRTTWTGKRIRADGTIDNGVGGVGRYLQAKMADQAQPYEEDEIIEFVDQEPDPGPARKKAKAGRGFGNFEGW
ncbi:cyclophilin peptidyl-prolyl cis-trans isomerase Cyp8 [Lithohypha guttulata]|uniref:cyclophilin peptidyl-prolyl cis-trans isomerase Cyp8 n=1 Tax=Lithohypha guttulata TaxID=1690604 RepID=UPI002DDF2781|nr:cyclophilin peptidyl-prolyl cis-trans isomerase Cyp8 [Lithohypha guttulata]